MENNNKTEVNGLKKVLKWGGYFIAGLIVLSIISAIATGDTTDSDAAVAEMQAKGEAIQAEKAEAKASKDAKEAKEKKTKEDAKAKEAAEIETQLADFSETRDAMVANSSGVITDMDIEHTGVHYKVNVYVDEATWASSSESEKESFATTIGTAVQGALSDTALVDFRSALNGDIVAEGKVFGGYKIKR
jgi:hypothetical protein